MTNSQIIVNEAINAGLYTENEIKAFVKEHGFSPVNTFVEWKKLGFIVKKDEKAKIKTKLWKYTNYKAQKLTEEEYAKMSQIMDISKDTEVPEKQNHYYLTSASLFDFSQVQKIA